MPCVGIEEGTASARVPRAARQRAGAPTWVVLLLSAAFLICIGALILGLVLILGLCSGTTGRLGRVALGRVRLETRGSIKAFCEIRHIRFDHCRTVETVSYFRHRSLL